MSSSDLSAGDISANNIQANGYITSGGDITTTSFINAGSASITDLLTTDLLTVTGSGNIPDLSVNTLQSTGTDLTIKAGITGARDITFIAKDIIMSNSDLSANDISANNIQANNLTATIVTASGAVTASNFILDDGNTFTDLSSNVDALDASMAFVEQTGFIRMRSNSQFLIDNSSSWIEISLSKQDSVFGSSITHSGNTEFNIGTKGIYSYSIQLGLTATGGVDFSVNNLELALTNGGSAPGSFTNSDINDSGSNPNGGFNKEFSEYYNMSFSSGDKCFISGNGIGQFNSDDRLKIFVKWNKTNPFPTRQFDINDPSGTIVTFALIQALE